MPPRAKNETPHGKKISPLFADITPPVYADDIAEIRFWRIQQVGNQKRRVPVDLKVLTGDDDFEIDPFSTSELDLQRVVRQSGEYWIDAISNSTGGVIEQSGHNVLFQVEGEEEEPEGEEQMMPMGGMPIMHQIPRSNGEADALKMVMGMLQRQVDSATKNPLEVVDLATKLAGNLAQPVAGGGGDVEKTLRDEITDMRRRHAQETDDLRRKAEREIDDARKRSEKEIDEMRARLRKEEDKFDRDREELKTEMRQTRERLERELWEARKSGEKDESEIRRRFDSETHKLQADYLKLQQEKAGEILKLQQQLMEAQVSLKLANTENAHLNETIDEMEKEQNEQMEALRQQGNAAPSAGGAPNALAKIPGLPDWASGLLPLLPQFLGMLRSTGQPVPPQLQAMASMMPQQQAQATAQTIVSNPEQGGAPPPMSFTQPETHGAVDVTPPAPQETGESQGQPVQTAVRRSAPRIEVRPSQPVQVAPPQQTPEQIMEQQRQEDGGDDGGEDEEGEEEEFEDEDDGDESEAAVGE